MTDLVMFFCPPLSIYPASPLDQSESEAVDCPICTQKMWLSIKKKFSIDLLKSVGKEIFLSCYICFEKKLLNMKKEGSLNFLNGDEFHLINL